MTLTKKNHYNPCFWTAIWNASYYDRFVRGEERNLKARDQVVAALNVKANKIFTRSVNDIHYDKNLGIAEITKDSAESFAERYHPDKYLEFLHNNSEDDYPVYIDFEDTLTELEKMPPYEVLLSTAKNRGIASLEEKAFLGYFILLQLHRSHAIMNSMLEWYANLGRTKFEHFIREFTNNNIPKLADPCYSSPEEICFI